MKKFTLGIVSLFISTISLAQQPTRIEILPSGDTLIVPIGDDDIVYDTTSYTSSGSDGNEGGFCNNSVSGLSPTKILSVGFDYTGPSVFNSAYKYDYTGGDTSTYNRNANFTGGLRISGNIPVVSRLKGLLNLGFNYWRTGYKFKEEPTANDFFGKRLQERGLSNLGLSLTFFKPLNNRHFIILMAQGEVSGDYNFKEFFNRFQYTKGSYTALFGWKKRENKLFAVGLSRTWRGGEPLPIPVILWNQTFNSKWGIELLLPARGAVRYNFSPRSLLLLGYELEGSSYNMQFNYFAPGIGSPTTNNKFEMRRSEIRARLTWEKQLAGFIWLSVQGGARLNYRNAVAIDNKQDRGNFVIDNNVGIAPYGIISINFITP
jgi:hypothetical protein